MSAHDWHTSVSVFIGTSCGDHYNSFPKPAAGYCLLKWMAREVYPNWVQEQKDLDSSQSLHSCVVTILYSYCVLLIHAPMHTSIYVGAWQVSSVTTVCVHACTHMYVDNYNNVSIYHRIYHRIRPVLVYWWVHHIHQIKSSMYRKRRKFRGGNIFAIFAGTITVQKYRTRFVHHVILVTLDFAIDSLWNIFNVALLPGSPWRRFTRPQGTTYHHNPATGHRRS